MSISLSKGSRISLTKDNGTRYDHISMGLGWDPAKASGRGFLAGLLGGGGTPTNIDLDASCGVFDANGHLIDTIWFRQLRSKDGNIQHSGDNLTGEGDGDDETIHVRLDRLSPQVKTLIFTINSFRGQTFDAISQASCRLLDHHNKQVIATYNISEVGRYTGLIVASLYRNNGEWKMRAIGAPTNGQVFADMLPTIREYL